MNEAMLSGLKRVAIILMFGMLLMGLTLSFTSFAENTILELNSTVKLKAPVGSNID